MNNRKHLKYLLFLITLAFLFGCTSTNKEKTDCEITYSIEYPDIESDLMKGFLPGEMVMKFKGSKAVSTIEMIIADIKIIADSENKQQWVLLKNMSQGYVLELDSVSIKEYNAKENPSVVLKSTPKSETILGYECSKVIAFQEGNSDFEHAVYYTQEIGIKSPNWNTPYYEIPNVMLEYHAIINGIHMKFRAKDINFKEIPDKDFDIPDDYKSVDMDAMTELIPKLDEDSPREEKLLFAEQKKNYSALGNVKRNIKTSKYFGEITTNDGLSSNDVNCIFKGSKGYMWFGTQKGLNKYDGYNFTPISYNPFDENSLSNNNINSIYEDRNGLMWIGTNGGGFNSYNILSQKVERYKSNIYPELKSDFVNTITGYKDILIVGTDKGVNCFNIDTKKSTAFIDNNELLDIIDTNVTSILRRDSLLYIATNGNGLIKYNIYEKSFKQYNQESKIGDDDINCLSMDLNKNLWVGTNKNGLIKIDTIGNIANVLTDVFVGSCPNNCISSLSTDFNGSLWIGVVNQGLIKYDINRDTYSKFENQVIGEDNDYNKVKSLYVDNSNILWIGTKQGIKKTVVGLNKFKHFSHNKDDINTISSNRISSILADTLANYWFGTKTGELNLYNRISGEFSVLTGRDKDLPITCMEKDDNSNLWIGTIDGVEIYNTTTKTFSKVVLKNSSGTNIYDEINCIEKGENNKIWIGTKYNGIICYDVNNKFSKQYTNNIKDTNSLSSNNVTCILEFGKKVLVGTYVSGLNIIDVKTNKFKRYYEKVEDSTSLSSNNISVIEKYQKIGKDTLNSIWIGTDGGGLNQYFPESDSFKVYTKNQDIALADNSVKGILFDDRGILWVSTRNGVSRYSPQIEDFTNYDIVDGLQSNEFSKAYTRTKDGYMLLGGHNGYNLFHPDSIKRNTSIPRIIISSIKKYSNEMLFDKHISEVKELELSYKVKEFTIEFAVLDYHAPEKNKYTYMLEGFHDWKEPGTKRSATYTSLPPGEYVFKVSGCNSDGQWNATSIRIIITPPFWQTLWFYIAVIVIFVGSISLVFYIRERNAKITKRILEDKVNKRTAQLMKKTDRLETKQLTLEFALNSLSTKRKELEKRNNQIITNIQHAKPLQDAVIPNENLINSVFPESFVYFMPKGILSGDFYWYYDKEDVSYIAVADSTAKGVLGATINVIARNYLKNIVKFADALKPSEILLELNKNLQLSLHQAFGQVTNDAIKISLICINKKENKLIYSGTDMPMLFVSDNDIKEYNNDVASVNLVDSSCKDVELEYMSGDSFYLFTDGYYKQIGGEENTEFEYDSFKNLLLKNNNESGLNKKVNLNKTLEGWKTNSESEDNVEQTDDIIVVGIKL